MLDRLALQYRFSVLPIIKRTYRRERNDELNKRVAKSDNRPLRCMMAWQHLEKDQQQKGTKNIILSPRFSRTKPMDTMMNPGYVRYGGAS